MKICCLNRTNILFMCVKNGLEGKEWLLGRYYETRTRNRALWAGLLSVF